jgi:hypothetical protein
MGGTLVSCADIVVWTTFWEALLDSNMVHSFRVSARQCCVNDELFEHSARPDARQTVTQWQSTNQMPTSMLS